MLDGGGARIQFIPRLSEVASKVGQFRPLQTPVRLTRVEVWPENKSR